MTNKVASYVLSLNILVQGRDVSDKSDLSISAMVLKITMQGC